MILAPGDVLEPVGVASPCGAHYGVVASGRAQLEMSERFVTKLAPGALLLDGLLAEFGAKLRATTRCEVYRFSEIDFRAAVVVPAANWFYRFRLLEVDTRKKMTGRLSSVRGAES